MKSFTPCPLVLLIGVSLACVLAACGADDSEGATERRQIGDGFAEVEGEVHEPLVIPEGSPRVVFLGDSITAGLHLSPDQAYPAALQRRLFAEGHPFVLQNAGESGATSAKGLRNADWALKTSPEIVVIQLGANEGLRAIDYASVEENLRAIVLRVRDAGAKPLLLGMDVPPNLEDPEVDFSEIYERIAKDLDVPLVPHFLNGVGGILEMNLEDGLHPTPAGHERLAENVYGALLALLEG